jgi:hypothetical protein
MTEQFANNAATTLSAAVETTDGTSISVASAAGFPTKGNFRILVDDEIMLVTAVDGTTWTVTRGAESTTGATHSNGAAVTHVLTAGAVQTLQDAANITYTPGTLSDWDGAADPGNADDAFDQLAERVADLEDAGGGGGATVYSSALASPPAAPASGDLWLPTDWIVLYRYDGAAWVAWGPIFPFGAPPVLGDFAWVNQGTATVTAMAGGVEVWGPAVAGNNVRALVQAAPATPYTITAMILAMHKRVNYAESGLLFRESASGKLQTVGLQNSTIRVTNLNSPTTWVTNAAQGPYYAGNLLWLRITDDGTDRAFAYSFDGYIFTTFYTVGRTSFLTADQVGFFVDAENPDYDVEMLLLGWREE